MKNVILFVLSSMAAAMLLTACVNEEYRLSEERLNLEMTVFQEGVALPLGSTDSLKLKDLVGMLDSTLVDKWINTGEGGEYSVVAKMEEDLSDQVNDLLSGIEIPDVKVSEQFRFQLEDVDVSGLKIQAKEYAYSQSVSDVVQVPDLTVPAMNQKFEASAGLHEYAFTQEDMLMDIEPLEYATDFAKIPSTVVIPAEIVNDTPVKIDPDTANEALQALGINMVLSTGFGPDHVVETFAMDMPKGLRSVKSLNFLEGAKVRMVAELTNSIFTEGTIMPSVDVDLCDIFQFADEENAGRDELTINHILEDFELPATGGRIEHEYKVKALVLNDEDWVYDPAVGLKLNKQVDVEVAGTLEYRDVYTTTRKIAESETRQMDISLSLEFIDFAIDEMVVEIEPVSINRTESVNINHTFSLGNEIEKVNYVDFTPASSIGISMIPENLDRLSGLVLTMDQMEISFPESIEVEGAVDGKVTYSGVDLSAGFNTSVKVKRFNLPDPVNGNLSLDEDVTVNAVLTGSGIISSKDIPTTEADDVRVAVDVNSSLEVSDYSVRINGFSQSISHVEDFFVELPAEMEQVGEVTVYPEGNPEIVISLTLPDAGVAIVPDPESGVVISFPSALKFKNVDSRYEYDPEAGTIAIKGDVPSQIVLPVDRLVVSPQVNEAGVLCIQDEISVSGSVSIASCDLVKAQVDALTSPDSKVSISVSVPEMLPSSLELEKPYSTIVKKEFAIEVMSTEGLPAELVSVGRVDLKDVYLNMQLDASSLPDLGETTMEMDFDIDVPDVIILDSDKVTEDNVLHVTGVLGKDGKVVIDPVKIAAIDLSGIDFDKVESIKDTIKVNGKVQLDNVALDVDSWLGKELEVGFSADISNIVLSKVTGQVDFSLIGFNSAVDLTNLTSEMEKVGVDVDLALNRFHVAVDIETNVGIPTQAELLLVPYYSGEASQEKTIRKNVVINHSPSASEVKHTKIWLSSMSKEEDVYRPDGFEHAQVALLDVLKDIPDSLKVSLDVASFPDQESVIEPTEKYLINVTCDAQIPMEFAEDFAVTFRDTIAVAEYNLTDFIAMGDLVFTGTATSSLPLEMELMINPLDPSGNKIPMDEATSRQKIAPCNQDGTPTDTDIYFGLKKGQGAKGCEVSDIEIVINATSAKVPGLPLKEDSFVKVKLQALVPEGITIDPRDFVENEEGE